MENELTFGIEGTQDLQELAKSLETGYSYGVTDQTGLAAIRLESIEDSMKLLIEEEKTSKFFKEIKKSKGSSTVEQWVSVENIGSANFYTEGGLPEEYDEELKREFELTKYLGTVGRVPNAAQSVKSLAQAKALIQKLKTIAMIREADIKSIFGNADNVSVEWNGYIAQFLKRVKRPSENIIDLRGKPITPETFAKAASIIEGNYGDPMNMKAWMAPTQFNDGYATGLIKNKYYVVGNNAIRTIADVPRTIEIGNGGGKIETDLHLRHKGETYLDNPHPKLNSLKTAFAATHDKAPVTLNAATASATVGDLAGSLLDAATYDYVVLPRNKYGAGAGFEIKSVVVAANKKVTFTLGDNGSPAGREASCFEVYRKLSSSSALSDYRYLKTIKASETNMVDDGSDIPGTTYVMIFDWNFDQVLDFKQLLPMVRMDLAVIDDSVRWLQKLYGTPALFNSNKMILVKNAGLA
ncbi:MAG TPA: hypothetical protein VHO03_16915 [Ignavibacteriales bacterium]|nr:hypothetical protein [Ignavibacteriales bacterium]